MKRRTFLKSLGVGASAFMLQSMLRPRSAAAAVDRSFVFCYFRGGWDTLLSLDPRDPNVFTEARRNETRIELGWDQIADTYPKTIQQPAGSNIDFGPVMGGIMQHYDKMCVVRGMTMDTVAHEVGRKYFITGLPPRGTAAAGSAVPTRIVSQQGDESALPNLVVGVETYNDGDPSYSSGLTVNSVSDLITTLTDGPAAPDATVRAHLDSYRGRAIDCDPVKLNRGGLLGLLRSSQTKARELVSSGLSSKFQFLNANDSEMTGLATRYGIANLGTVQAYCAMTLQALKYEMAQCVTIEMAGNLDTHDADWATDQPDSQFAAWTALGQLVTDLEATPDPSRGGTLLDHTTILCFSEFGRTALLNGRGGRDHSLTSSCMMLGAGIPTNKVVGKSSDTGMTPGAVNMTTGAPDDSGVLVTPTLVIASMMHSAGLDTLKLRTDGLPCLIA
jgi:uncharacterized protein (DUF1501 family)